MRRSQFHFLILLLVIPIYVKAQVDVKVLKPDINPSQFKIHPVGPEDGFSAPYIFSAFQDQYGFIWTGTENGVDIYDGYAFDVKRKKDSDSLSNQVCWVNGLSDHEDGGLWISSLEGLFYYDRLKDEIFTHFYGMTYPEIGNEQVMGVWQDGNGLYWVFTGYGLFHLDRDKDMLTKTPVPRCRSWRYVGTPDFNLLVTGDSLVWIPTDPYGLFRYNLRTRKFTNYLHDPANPGSISSNRVTDIIEDVEGNLWITTWGGGINLLNAKDLNYFHKIRFDQDMEKGMFSDTLLSVIQDRSGTLWFCGLDAFASYDSEKRSFRNYHIKRPKIEFGSPDISYYLTEMYEDYDGDIWLITDSLQGAFCFSPGSEELFHFIQIKGEEQDDIKGDSWVKESFCDRGGLIWIVTHTQLNIIEKNPRRPFYQFKQTINDPGSLNNSIVWAVLVDSEGYLWVSDEGAVLNGWKDFNVDDPPDFKHYSLEHELPDGSMISDIVEGEDDILWIGTWKGLYQFDKKSGEFTRFDPGKKQDDSFDISFVDDLMISQDGKLWIADRVRGLHIWDPGSCRLRQIETDVDNTDYLMPMIFTIEEDRDGSIWFGHLMFGVSKLPAGEVHKVFTSDSLQFLRYSRNYGKSLDLSSDNVMDIHQDMLGRIWFSTTAGLNLLNPEDESITSFHRSDGLPNDCVNGILEDEHGNLWISSLNGICKIELDEGYGPEVIRSINNYGMHDGIEKPVFHEKSCFKSPEGWMFFGGIYGLTVFHPDSIRENTIIPPVHITNVLVNDEDITQLEKRLIDQSVLETSVIRLPYRYNFLSFEYVAINYLISEKNRYKYIMEGLDKDWIEAGTRRLAEYRDLNPGDYTFRVIACNEDGLWNEEGDSIRIIVDPPWYRSGLAYISYIMLLITGVYVIIRWRTRQLLRDKHKLESQVKARTKTIELQNEELEQQKEELQITLDNLKQTQSHLIQSEKLAALGGLVAGVAHEMNTPLGISVTAASSLVEETQQMAEKYKNNKISHTEFKEYLNAANQSGKLILSNMERAASLVQSFKLVSVDQSTEQKRKFKLKDYTEDVILSLYPKLKDKKIDIKLDIPEIIELDGYPGAFSQILTNLLLNSYLHGFKEADKGRITLSASLHDHELSIDYTDDGIGILPEHLPEIFNPFFTTDNTLGTGLGLHIVYNIVNQKLKGSINCFSKSGEGVQFHINFPV